MDLFSSDRISGDCDKTGVKGFCCPIGTVCYYNGIDTALTCINAYGSSAPAYPSSTSGVVPSATPVANTEAEVVYSPQNAWSTSNTAPSCAEESSMRVTSTLNASVSFNYSGPSVMVHTITSPTGGVFAVFIDGFNTTSTLDTFSSSSSSQAPSLPLCYPTQYPPVLVPPPDMEMKDSHTITLVYVGPSPNAPAGTESSVQFDAFAIPDFSKVLSPLTSSAMEGNRMMWQGGFIATLVTIGLLQILIVTFGY
ncbi:hypothetical protein CVT26_005772 [Gymnopilus dilepis]|uniref:Uncharacterized protein n=1 Tax=Gymnopilus dilepis TaxID=231916 RepID=A0A409VPN8_9AGAR|nr:hypothetical protein CVT26_005772 [Gymnopilus dilepis]